MGWQKRFLGIDSWASLSFSNSGSLLVEEEKTAGNKYKDNMILSSSYTEKDK